MLACVVCWQELLYLLRCLSENEPVCHNAVKLAGASVWLHARHRHNRLRLGQLNALPALIPTLCSEHSLTQQIGHPSIQKMEFLMAAAW